MATIHLQGEGGVVFEHDLPLNPHIAKRHATGHLRRVNADGTPYVEPVDGPVDEGQGAPPAPVMGRPSVRAPKSDWVSHAVYAHGANPEEADGLTKLDLIERYGTVEPPVDPPVDTPPAE